MKTVAKWKCPKCGETIKGLVSTSYIDALGYRRYRKCEKCGGNFATIERIAYAPK